MIRVAGILVLATGILLTVACSFTPAECDTFDRGINDSLYRDFLRGENEGQCYEFRGDILEPVGDTGYRVSTAEWETSYETDDVFLYWQSEEPLVEGDLVAIVGMVVEPLSYETVLGAERSIPAFHGSRVERLR